MASRWPKSLHCKTTAFSDVHLPIPTTSSKKPSLSCTPSSQTLRDIVSLNPNKSPQTKHRNPKSKPKPNHNTSPSPPPPPPPVSLPTLINLPNGNSSRRVVELIFTSSWSPLLASPFPGQIEMLFRVHYPPRYVARFEDHRAAVRSRSDGPRCAADGNEMMRFHPSVAAAGAIYNAGVVLCAVGEMKGVRTFAGSGGAHDVSGGGLGRRAMLVCRVIAGRVADECGLNSEADSVSLRKGELLVFDPRAVLPCFLIIYKVST